MNMSEIDLKPILERIGLTVDEFRESLKIIRELSRGDIDENISER